MSLLLLFRSEPAGAAMARLRPASDITITANWYTHPTPSQPHWQQLDEAIASDVDYVKSVP